MEIITFERCIIKVIISFDFERSSLIIASFLLTSFLIFDSSTKRADCVFVYPIYNLDFLLNVLHPNVLSCSSDDCSVGWSIGRSVRRRSGREFTLPSSYRRTYWKCNFPVCRFGRSVGLSSKFPIRAGTWKLHFQCSDRSTYFYQEPRSVVREIIFDYALNKFAFFPLVVNISK